MSIGALTFGLFFAWLAISRQEDQEAEKRRRFELAQYEAELARRIPDEPINRENETIEDWWLREGEDLS